jgi:NAD+ diphosphatase
MTADFVPSVKQDLNYRGKAWHFLFSDYKLLVNVRDGSPSVICAEGDGSAPGGVITGRQYLGVLHGLPCWAAEVQVSGAPPGGTALMGLRSLYGQLDESSFKVALLGAHLSEWNRTYLFCHVCGGAMRLSEDVRAKNCPTCGRLEFPRISPAVIVLIERGREVLLARAARFTENMYSVLAGFVEPGESLEEAVRREVAEEVGIELADITYFGSQPWPFPDSLMIGFTARWAGGDIVIDGEEIVEAGWYSVENLPPIPGRISIARRLIDWFIEKHNHKD